MKLTDKHKEAIKVLTDLFVNNFINEDDYFLLLEFIVDGDEPQITYVPVTPPQPLDPIYGKFGPTCIVEE